MSVDVPDWSATTGLFGIAAVGKNVEIRTGTATLTPDVLLNEATGPYVLWNLGVWSIQATAKGLIVFMAPFTSVGTPVIDVIDVAGGSLASNRVAGLHVPSLQTKKQGLVTTTIAFTFVVCSRVG